MAAPKPLLSVLRLFGLTRRRLLIIGASTCVVRFYCCGYGLNLVSLQSSHGVAESTPSVAGYDSTSKIAAIEQSEFLIVLQNLYGAHASHIHHSDAIDVEERKQMGDAATYGEILPDGVLQLFSALGGLHTDDFFVDLGSGTGKVCIQAHLMTSSGKTMGVELGKQRHALALEASQKLEARGLRDYSRVLSFIQGDAMALFHMWNSATVVFMNSLRFPPHLMCGLSKLFADLAPGTIVVSSKPLLGCHSCCRSINAMLLRASWHDKVKLHIYAIPPRVDDLHHISLSMNFTQIQAATVARNSPWSQVVQKNEHRRELLGSPNSLEWGSVSVAGEEFSLAACKLRDVYDCVVEPHSPRLDVAALAPGGRVLPAGIDALSRVAGARMQP